MNRTDRCFGTPLKRVSHNCFELSLTKYEPHQVIDFHYHTSPYYSMVLAGGYYERNEFESTPVSDGVLVSRPSDYLHHNVFGKNLTYCFNIEFPEYNTFNFHNELKKTRYSLNNSGPPKIHLWKLYQGFLDDSTPLEMESVLMEMIAEEHRLNHQPKKSAHVTGWLTKLEEYLNSHWDDKTSLKELSELVNVSPIYMIRAFKNKYGMTIGEYHVRVRLNHAVRCLMNSHQSVSETAFQCGFYDQSHFTKNFKRVFGRPPSDFQKTVKKFI
ncbi:MAG: helix-turn-helix transcriptional regulator [Cyclobacteriaceae bacterium]|nr:helix-turn-helix transcriptional regulator [Cyclobacteriaceae bacterium]